MKNIVKGDIFYADLNPVIGSEQKGCRPVLVIQNNIGNKYSPTVLIAPISTKKEKVLPTHIFVKQFEKIRKDSIILLEQIRVIDKCRLRGYVGKIEEAQMKEVEKAISISFDL